MKFLFVSFMALAGLSTAFAGGDTLPPVYQDTLPPIQQQQEQFPNQQQQIPNQQQQQLPNQQQQFPNQQQQQFPTPQQQNQQIQTPYIHRDERPNYENPRRFRSDRFPRPGVGRGYQDDSELTNICRNYQENLVWYFPYYALVVGRGCTVNVYHPRYGYIYFEGIATYE